MAGSTRPWRGGRLSKALASVSGALAAVAVLSLAVPAEGRSTYDSSYGFDRTYNAALRLVRIDLGLKITEKDDKSGYFVFDYKAADTGNKVSTGSFEFVRAAEPDAPVRVVVQLPQMPRYHEQVLVDALVRKMRADYGDPVERPKLPPAREPPKDAGAPDGGDEDAS